MGVIQLLSWRAALSTETLTHLDIIYKQGKNVKTLPCQKKISELAQKSIRYPVEFLINSSAKDEHSPRKMHSCSMFLCYWPLE